MKDKYIVWSNGRSDGKEKVLRIYQARVGKGKTDTRTARHGGIPHILLIQ